MAKKEPHHNAHLLVPKDTWDRAKHQSIMDGLSMTAFVTRALDLLVSIRTKGLEDKVRAVLKRKRSR